MMVASHPYSRVATAVKKRIVTLQTDFSSWASVKHLSCLSASVPQRFLSSKTPPHSSGAENPDVDKQVSQIPRENSSNGKQVSQHILREGAWPFPLRPKEKQLLTPVSRFKSSNRREYKQNHSSRRKQQQGINDYNDFESSLVKASDYLYRRLPHCESETGNAGPALSSSLLNSTRGWDALRPGVTSTRRRGETTKSEHGPSTSSSTGTVGTNNRLKILPSIDASALLNPKKYCKDTAKFSHAHNVHRTIHGTEAARRLLRGKKDFIVAARKLMNAGSTPMLLEGHGVPLPLFQHCVDLADALLLHYGSDVVECSFRNYHNSGSSSSSSQIGSNCDDDSNIPLYFRVLKRNALKATLESKPYFCRFQHDESGEDPDMGDFGDVDFIEWDHHLKLYLTVMERLATGLGLVLEVSSPQRRDNSGLGSKGSDRTSDASRSKPPDIDEFDYFDDDDEEDDKDNDFTSSPLLFPLRPYWNVTIVRNAHFDLQPNRRIHHSPIDIVGHDVGWDGDRNRGKKGNEDRRRDGRAVNGPRPPLPIVEVIQERSKAKGHIVISLQGYAVPNEDFSDTRRRQSRQPVTLMFDACFRKPPPSFS